MKKVFFMLFISVFIGSICFSEEAPAPSSKIMTFTGKVDSVSIGDVPGKRKSRMAVRGDKGFEAVFIIAADATVTGKDGNPTTLSWISGKRIYIEYTIAQDGFTKTAKSIKVVPD